MKMIEVACAIIERAGLVLAAQRGKNMSLPLKWEFPGGKLHAGETPRQCLERELREELDASPRIETALATSEHRYPEFAVRLFPFVCTLDHPGPVHSSEHRSILWLPPAQLPNLDWAEADWPVLRSYLAWRGYAIDHPRLG